MKNAYLIVVHIVNILLLVPIGFVLLGSIANISPPGEIPNFTVPRGLSVSALIIIWIAGYWFQLKKRNWIFPIVAIPLFLAIGYFLLGVAVPYFDRMIYL